MDRPEYGKMFAVEDVHWWFAAKRKLVGAYLRDLRLGARILDVGCGTGAMSTYLARFGEVTGIDVSADALGFSRRRGLARLVRGDLGALPFADASFDLVVACDVLYHQWVDEERALGEIRRVLAPGGRLVVTDSALPILAGRHDRFVHARERYTVAGLSDRIERAGLSVTRASYAHFFTFPLFIVSRLLDHLRPAPTGTAVGPVARPLNVALSIVTGVEAMLHGRVRLPIGSSVVIVARRD